jgi:Inner membrane component of T3SS, cytoplasmic domain
LSGEALWIEVLSRHDEVIARHRMVLDDGATIGRAYDNQVILDDPYVAPRHLRVVRDANGALVAEDAGSANGLFVGEDRRRVERVVLDGGRAIRIGRTRLRIRQASDAVAPERISRPRVRLWPLILAVAVAVLAGESLTTWLRATTEQKVGHYLGQLLMLCAALGAWSAAWSVLSRIFSGRARFVRHLLIALGGVLAMSLFSELSAYAAFAFSGREFIVYRYIGMWLLAAGVCFLHLRQLSQSRETGGTNLKLKAGAVALLALIGICMQTLSQWEASERIDREGFLRGLKPPMLRLAAQQSASGFFADVARLQGKLDRARAEQPARVWVLAGDDDTE